MEKTTDTAEVTAPMPYPFLSESVIVPLAKTTTDGENSGYSRSHGADAVSVPF
jgi:hypothetical protein